jgi:hypothetical protein
MVEQQFLAPKITEDIAVVLEPCASIAEEGREIVPQAFPHPRDPLHGVTLENILQQLLAQHGWAEMGSRIRIRCFQSDPSIKSSLTFLRKTPWARAKVEDWFIEEQWNKRRAQRSDPPEEAV